MVRSLELEMDGLLGRRGWLASKKGCSPRWSRGGAFEPAGQMPDTVKGVVDDEEQAADVVDALLARKS
jgi:hypothetical protein